MKRRTALWLPAVLLPGRTAAADDDAALSAALRAGGVAVVLRHALTEAGVGDPPGFRAGDCATQRNLSAEGRDQAQRIGAWFRDRELRPVRVRSSAWCRCLDTATLAFGRAEPWAVLNSSFGEGAPNAAREAAIDAALARIGAHAFEVWVTHQVNIAAMIGASVAMGEGCVLRRAAAARQLVGRSRFGA